MVRIVRPPSDQGAEGGIATRGEDVNGETTLPVSPQSHLEVYTIVKWFLNGDLFTFYDRMIRPTYCPRALVLQHDVAPVMRLVLAIAPAGRRIHRVRGIELVGPSRYRCFAVIGKPARFVQSPANQQQRAGRRQEKLPTSHLSPPCPLKSAAFLAGFHGVIRARERTAHVPPLRQAAESPIFVPRLAMRCTRFSHRLQQEL